MSKQYENDMAKEMHRATDDSVRAVRAGFSGSNAMPQPDVLVTTPTGNYGLELKGPIQSDTVRITEDDLEQLLEFANGYTRVGLVVKFSRREPLVVMHIPHVSGIEGWEDMSAAEQFQKLIPSAIPSRVSDESGALLIDKPGTDDWPSAQAGSADHDAILSGLGIPTDKSIEIETS
jgi:Holliday junction resolvase